LARLLLPSRKRDVALTSASCLPGTGSGRISPIGLRKPTGITVGRLNRFGTFASRHFHVMATEGAVHADEDHVWHMDTISSFANAHDPLLMTTPYHVVDLTNVQSEASATEWWMSLTESGGEGAVVKPKSFVATGSRGLLQPAIKCRGREYLRIIYGPEYTLPEHLNRLRERGLSAKRSLALREFALGIEALERFVQKSLSDAFTNAYSECLPWRVSPSIRGYRPGPGLPSSVILHTI
jgi:hypothetical protein